MTHDERLAKAVALIDLSHRDADAARIIVVTCATRKQESLGHLAANLPEVFDEMAELIDDMCEQIPTDTRPGYLR